MQPVSSPMILGIVAMCFLDVIPKKHAHTYFFFRTAGELAADIFMKEGKKPIRKQTKLYNKEREKNIYWVYRVVLNYYLAYVL